MEKRRSPDVDAGMTTEEKPLLGRHSSPVSRKSSKSSHQSSHIVHFSVQAAAPTRVSVDHSVLDPRLVCVYVEVCVCGCVQGTHVGVGCMWVDLCMVGETLRTIRL